MASAFGEDVGGDVTAESAVLRAGYHVVVDGGGDENGLRANEDSDGSD